MKINYLILFFEIIIFFQTCFAQISNPPKREFRAAWVATVVNLDWPPSPLSSTTEQKAGLITILDDLKASGINTIIFQIRTECDALYQSGIDPWSYWLTGSQGFPPSPYYDPLEFAIEEAHKRGIELHAWFNPYRADRSLTDYSPSSNHVTNTHPDWVITIGNFKFLDPGLPMVRDYVVSVIYDVVSRYDIDGVHFDDYFYPYEGINNEDSNTFKEYHRGIESIKNWRRDNVNLLVKSVYDTIQSVKPYVKFGISPFGIWRPGYPAGITGLDAYDVIYCDAITWLQDQSIDYLTPQLYWPIGGGQDYYALSNWWADSVAAHQRHLYPGHAAYRISTWTESEMPNQIKIDRNNPDIQGSVFFRTKVGILDNPKGFNDSLKNNLYRYKALHPVMSWKDNVNPNPPQNLSFGKIDNGIAGLKWDIPEIASDGDSASRYVVYRFKSSDIQEADLTDPANILEIEGRRFNIPREPPDSSGPYYFVITSLDRNYNESQMSNVVEVIPPLSPMPVFPLSGSMDITDTLILRWNRSALASFYKIQVSTEPSFNSNIFLDESGITDTTKTITGMEGLTQYYWRVSAVNAGGLSNFSSAFNFTTGFPAAPLLVFPPDNTGNYPGNINLSWVSSDIVDSYHLQVARALDFSPQSMIIDTIGLSDTTFTLNNLLKNTFYFWRIKAFNQFGGSTYSETWRFKTETPVSVEEDEEFINEFGLYQNYPNPFNPETTINFNLPHSGFVNVKVFNVLGEEVATVANGFFNQGKHKIFFNAANLPSGIYIYKLISENYSSSKKMVLLK